jgi:K+-sensing histidine kinase KdpD
VDAAREHQGSAGEGLGLAIAARALAAHGGMISAHNMPGGGLAVVVALPFCETESAPSRASAAEPASSGLSATPST